MSETEKKEEKKEENKGINLAIRLNATDYQAFKDAAKDSGFERVSTWIKWVCRTNAGDTRPLETLLKSVCQYLEDVDEPEEQEEQK